jgi:hypothetical protein
MQTAMYLKDVIQRFQELKQLADKAIAQAGTKDFRTMIDQESNSIAILMKHLAGNMKSRWSDFLTTDGEKPDRNRDQEFEDSSSDDSIRTNWEQGWRVFLDTLSGLKPEDLDKTVLIRNEPHTVFQAINRQLTHYGYHVGQIVFLAKHLASDHWKSLSIPRNESGKFNQKKFGSQR